MAFEEQLEKLFELKAKGAITEEEYQQRKAQLSNEVSNTNTQPQQDKKPSGCLSKIFSFKGIVIIILLAMLGHFAEQSEQRNKAKKAEEAKTTTTVSATKTPEPKVTPKPTKPATPTSTKISPSQLVREYDANEVAADQKYKGKRLTVSGSIDDIGKDIMGTAYITLSSNHMFRDVQCFFPDVRAGQVAGLSKGQTVTVTGVCNGLMMHVILQSCTLNN